MSVIRLYFDLELESLNSVYYTVQCSRKSAINGWYRYTLGYKYHPSTRGVQIIWVRAKYVEVDILYLIWKVVVKFFSNQLLNISFHIFCSDSNYLNAYNCRDSFCYLDWKSVWSIWRRNLSHVLSERQLNARSRLIV